MSRHPYTRPVSRTTWWLRQARYTRYMLRELSSLFIGAFGLLLIVGLFRLSQGRAVYDAFLAGAGSMTFMVFAALTMIFAIYHSYTWFVVTPKAMPIALGGKQLPGSAIIAAHWVAFVIASALVWWLVSS